MMPQSSAKTIDTYNKERHSVENEITKQAIAEIESRPDEKYARRHSGVG